MALHITLVMETEEAKMAGGNMTEPDEFACEQQEDGRWFVLRNGQFLVACPTESVAREIAEILRKDAAEDG